MKNGHNIKRITDFAMVILLPVLMAEILVGQEVHEYIGAVMLTLFFVHHLLNLGWWRSFYKGKYTPSRTFGTALDLLLLLDMAAQGVSGIMMSDFVFRFLNLRGGMVFARPLHLLASHWGLIFMSAHLGMHMELFLGMGRKLFGLSGKNAARTWVSRITAAVLSVYGIYAFFTQHMMDYLFLRTNFVMFDETKPAVIYFAETAAMIVLFAAAAHYINKMLRRTGRKSERKQPDGRGWRALTFIVPAVVCIFAAAEVNFSLQNALWEGSPAELSAESSESDHPAETSAEGSGSDNLAEESTGAEENVTDSAEQTASEDPDEKELMPDLGESSESAFQSEAAEDGFVLIKGGSFAMGSPEDEPWRSADETQHTVTVSDFYISPYEVRQSEYTAVMGSNPSSFSGDDDLPVENVSWLDAIAFCNALSENESLTPAYSVGGETVTWDRSADGYRLPTEAEWEYACRAGTTTPFNTETSISPEESNYYGHYPYEIENNYFSQGNLTTKPGEYRQTTVAVDSFSPNAWGLYNMHGNVSEWVWDYYGEYEKAEEADPAGPETGTRRVYRGGGWNDFAKNMRSAYRATLPEDKGSFNLGIRLVRNAVNGKGSVVSAQTGKETGGGGKVLIAFFSWGDNTRGIAEEIQSQTRCKLLR